MILFALLPPTLRDPSVEGRYRSIHTVGTWTSWQCDGGAEHNTLGAPLLVEWEADGHEVADVSWAYAGYDFIVSAHARNLFEQIGPHFHFEDVISDFGDIRSDSQFYKGIVEAQFSWPVPVKAISIDPVRNALERVVACPNCGAWKYVFKLTGLQVDRTKLDELDAFCIQELGKYAPVFVSESYKDLLTATGLKNVGFVQAGAAS